jgi:Zn-dependent protease/predicted transcriptional regulator
MRWSFSIGRIAGIRVNVHVTFLLFIGWIAATRGLLTGQPAQALSAVLLLVLVFGCVLLHELGHALAARRYGIPTRDITLLPIGGVARLARMPDQPRQEIVVAIAGPLVNVVIAGALFLVSRGLHHSVTDMVLRGDLLETLLLVNVVMILFNLVPAFPMDGGRVLRALMAMAMPYERATRIASFIGQGIAILFAMAGLVTGQFTLVLIAMFVFLAAAEERTHVETRMSIGGLPVSAAMVTEFHVLEPHDRLRRAVDFLMSGSQQDFPVVDGRSPVGILTRADLAHGLREHGAESEVAQAMRRDEEYADAGEPLERALQRMRERGRSALPVLQNGALVGLITLDNIGDLLIVREALRRYAGAGAG